MHKKLQAEVTIDSTKCFYIECVSKMKLNGDAIALGHPLAASGSRITAHLVHELRFVNKL